MSDPLHPLVALMRRYSYAYTASHDFAVSRELMVPDYELWMGEHRIVGHQEQYVPATERVYREFPGLGFVVHDVVCDGERIALRFSEHGRSVTRGGTAVWAGISTYTWDGARLTRCLVEQDYWSRRDQLHSGAPRPIEPPGMDPWTAPVTPADATTEDVVRSWLARGDLLDAEQAVLDDEWCSPAARVRVDGATVDVEDLFTAGDRAPFHATVRGTYAGGLPGLEGAVGAPVRVPVAGLARVAGGEVVEMQAVTGRLDAFRQLTAAGAAGDRS